MKRPRKKPGSPRASLPTDTEMDTPEVSPRARIRLLVRLLPYLVITGSAAIFYWPILSAQGWLWNDFPEQNFIYRLFAAVNLRQGIFPFWNPYVFSGLPFFADVQAAVLYPLNLLLTPFASADWLSPLLVEYQIILHFVLAGIFMFWLCRDWGCGRSGAVAGALAFMFCGTLTSHIFHTNLIQTAAWFPLIVMLFHRMMERRSLVYLSLCSLTLATAFLAGYPQFMLFMYYFLGVYGLFIIFRRTREARAVRASRLDLGRRSVQAGLFAALVALSIGLSSVQLLPTNELGKNSARPTLGFKESCEGSLHPYRVITLLVPKIFGTPQTAYWGVSENDVRGGVHSFWETATYCGILPLFLALFAVFFVRTPLVFFLSIMGAMAFLLSMGDSTFLYHLVYSMLPGFNRFRIPGRFAFILNFSVSILAAFGLQGLLHLVRGGNERWRKHAMVGAIGLSTATLVAAMAVSSGMCRGWIVDFIYSAKVFGNNAVAIGQYVDREIYPAVTGSFWIFALLALASGALIWLRLAGRIGPKITAAAAVAILFIDALIYGYGFAALPESPLDIYRKDPGVAQLQDELRTGFFRINSRDSKPGTDDLGGSRMLFRKNEGSVDRLFFMEGYNPLRLKRELVERGKNVLDILNVKYAVRVDEQTQRAELALNPTYLPRARMVFRYRVIVDEDSILPTLRGAAAFDHVKSVILESQPDFVSCDSCDSIGWHATIVNYGLNAQEVEVKTDREGLLVLSEIHYPCWKASVDGRAAPLYRADYALRAIPVPAGTHRVRCYNADNAFRRGAMLSLLSLALTLGALGIGLQGRARKKRTDTITAKAIDRADRA